MFQPSVLITYNGTHYRDKLETFIGMYTAVSNRCEGEKKKLSKISKPIPFAQVTCEGDQSYRWYDLTSVFVIRALVNALIRLSGYQYVTEIILLSTAQTKKSLFHHDSGM